MLISRRNFVKQSAVVGIAASTLSIARSAHAEGSDIIKVGLVGCGGRGTGAAHNALEADPNQLLRSATCIEQKQIRGCCGMKRLTEDALDY